MKKSTVKLYMRQRCHLCEDAKGMLEDLQQSWNFEIVEVDIDQDDRLVEEYGIIIPVIELDGEEVQAGIIHKKSIIEALTRKNVNIIS
ncbi:MAG: glutaredoxin family protein [Bacillota bacterium]